MYCSYFSAGLCRSCTLMGQPYPEQLNQKNAALHNLFCRSSLWIDTNAWLPPFPSPESHFRNKAKLVVGGNVTSPTLGIVGPNKMGIDISGCQLYEPALTASFEKIRAFIIRAKLTPFNVTTGRGELKTVLITSSPDEKLMIRFVLRSTEALVRIRKHLAWLIDQLGNATVITVNLLPERKAVLEGEEEIFLTEQESLPMKLGKITLHVRPQSFFQTNTAVAQGLYKTARNWVADINPTHLWDLYCGVGGFALHCADSVSQSIGVEISEQAVQSAKRSASEARVNAHFFTGDAGVAARELGEPEFIIVNPPRRGIGNLAQHLNQSEVQHVLYSSCNPVSLVSDLLEMPGFQVTRARMFDMFPHTSHTETLVLLTRK